MQDSCGGAFHAIVFTPWIKFITTDGAVVLIIHHMSGGVVVVH